MKVNYEKLLEVVKDINILNSVEEVLRDVSHHFVDITKVEERIYSRIIRVAESGVIKRVTANTIRSLAAKEASYLIENNRYTDVDSSRFSELDLNADDGSTENYEPVDDKGLLGTESMELQDILSTILPNPDRRRSIIISEWLGGETNDRDIARLLTDKLGGKLKTHTTFISRFKLECRDKLGGLMS